MARRRISTETASPLHLTGRAHNRDAFPLPLDEVWEIFQERLFFAHHAFGIGIHSFVLMPNHYHAIVSDPNGRLSVAAADLMRETAKEINRRARRRDQLWGTRYFSSVLGTPQYFLNCYKYVYQNPLRAVLCRRVEEYRFSTLHGLLGQSRLLIPILEDVTLFTDVERSLEWLNQLPSEKDLQAVRVALQRRTFNLPRDPFTGRAHRLEEATL